MKIDKKSLDALLSMPDDKMWQMLNIIASASGVKLDNKIPDKKQMDKIRRTAGEITDNDIERATELFNIYKKGEK